MSFRLRPRSYRRTARLRSAARITAPKRHSRQPCVVPEGTVIGENPEEDRNRFEVTADGNVVVTRQMLGQSASYHPGLVSGG